MSIHIGLIPKYTCAYALRQIVMISTLDNLLLLDVAFKMTGKPIFMKKHLNDLNKIPVNLLVSANASSFFFMSSNMYSVRVIFFCYNSKWYIMVL